MISELRNYYYFIFFSRLLGPTALIQLSASDGKLLQQELRRPLYNQAMRGAIVCFTGYRAQRDLVVSIAQSISKEITSVVSLCLCT